MRPRFAFLFEVEWTAMLGEPVLRRGRRIPADERIVRFVVLAPERVELVRREARAIGRAPGGVAEAGNWHILRTDALRRFAALPSPSLGDLRAVPRPRPGGGSAGHQLPLFDAAATGAES